MEIVQAAFEQAVQGAILLMELIGVIVMVISAAKAVVGVLKRDEHVRLNLAGGIALALEFKLGGEVLRTLVVRSLDELAILGAVVLLRAAIAVLIQWGIKKEEARLEDDKRETQRKRNKKPAVCTEEEAAQAEESRGRADLSR